MAANPQQSSNQAVAALGALECNLLEQKIGRGRRLAFNVEASLDKLAICIVARRLGEVGPTSAIPLVVVLISVLMVLALREVWVAVACERQEHVGFFGRGQASLLQGRVEVV